MQQTSTFTKAACVSIACLGFMLGFLAPAHAQDKGFQTLNPAALPPAHGYSHIVVAPVGRLVTISGQVAMDANGNIVGKDDFAKQCAQVFENIDRALKAVDLTYANVTRTDMFVTDLSHLSELRTCRTHYLPAKHPPAANLAKVDSLFLPGLMLEVSVQAVIPQRSGDR